MRLYPDCACRVSSAGAITIMTRHDPVDETVSCKDMVVREHGGESAVDPVRRASGRQRLMLRDPKTGQSVILPVDGRETGGYEVSGPPGKRFVVVDRAKPTRSSAPFSRSSAGTVRRMISSPSPSVQSTEVVHADRRHAQGNPESQESVHATPDCIPPRSDSPSYRKRGTCSSLSLELRR
jgi:hypothetical protein